MDCALGGGLRASPSAPMCAKTPNGVGCGHRPSREHGRPAPRPRVRPFPATIDPAGTSASADCCRVTGCLSATGVGRIDFPGPTSRQPSPDKTSDLPRTPTASTLRPLDGIGLRHAKLARPDRPALYAQPTRTPKGLVRHVFLGSRFCLRLPSHPASRRRSCHWLVVGAINLHRGLSPPARWSCRAYVSGRGESHPPALSEPVTWNST